MDLDLNIDTGIMDLELKLKEEKEEKGEKEEEGQKGFCGPQQSFVLHAMRNVQHVQSCAWWAAELLQKKYEKGRADLVKNEVSGKKNKIESAGISTCARNFLRRGSASVLSLTNTSASAFSFVSDLASEDVHATERYKLCTHLLLHFHLHQISHLDVHATE